MWPTKIEASASAEIKRKYKIVRLDDGRDVEGDILAADSVTGECTMQKGGEAKTLVFGPDGFRIVSR